MELQEQLADNLARNLRFLRQARNITQAQLAEKAEIPRSTLANLETGTGNPTLAVLGRLVKALQISVEELLSAPCANCVVYKKGELPQIEKDQRGFVLVQKLLPDPIPGMAIERITLDPHARMGGVPHRPGTKEYLYCEAGQLTLFASGERYHLSAGDVASFRGDQPHSYVNETGDTSVGFSVVVLVR